MDKNTRKQMEKQIYFRLRLPFGYLTACKVEPQNTSFSSHPLWLNLSTDFQLLGDPSHKKQYAISIVPRHAHDGRG